MNYQKVVISIKRILLIEQCPADWKGLDLYLFRDDAVAFYAVSDNAAHYPPESLNTRAVFAATHEAHQAIAKAIAARKPVVAQRAMMAHLDELEAAALLSGSLDEPLIRGKAPAPVRR